MGAFQGFRSRPASGRLKAWRELNKFRNFEKVAEVSGMAVAEIDRAARYGDHDDKCHKTDWGLIQKAIDELTGRAARKHKARAAGNTTAQRIRTKRIQKRLADLLAVLPGEIEDDEETFDELDARVIRRGIRKIATKQISLMVEPTEIVQIADELDVTGFIPPTVEYWGEKARKQRSNLKARLRVARMWKKNKL